ncbi:MAG: hypothetical protein ABII12_14475 [Planctomycetota bacterium]
MRRKGKGMVRNLFWAALVCVAVAAAVIYYAYRGPRLPRAKIEVEDVRFVDSEGRTPTLAEMADRVFARYTESEFISFDVRHHSYMNRYEVSAQFWAARERFKSIIDVDTVTFLGTTSDLFTIKLLLKDGMVREEWLVAKDGSHAVTTYTPEKPTSIRKLMLRDNMEGYICGMATGLWSTPIDNYDSSLPSAYRGFIRQGKLLGAQVIDGRRCAVVEYYFPDSPWHSVLAVNPDYFVVRDSIDGDGKVYRTLTWHNISMEPIPDDVWK